MTSNLSHITHAYFIGIGGIGMSALARYLKQQHGTSVRGYDRTATPLTDAMQMEDISIVFDSSEAGFPEAWLPASHENILAVRTAAISSNHPHYRALERKGVKVIKRSELLGIITQDKPSLAIAGTHGKTTTTALLAHMLDTCPQGCNAFLGGIATGRRSNLYTAPNALWTVVEADEYDRSFLHLQPQHAAITSLDPDHLDVYGTPDSFGQGFQAFADRIVGTCIVESSIARSSITHHNLRHYGIVDSLQAANGFAAAALTPKLVDGRLQADVAMNGTWYSNVRFPMPGLHNVSNTLAALALAQEAGAPLTTCLESLPHFAGIQRRFAYQIRKPHGCYIDDYAHHPSELQAAIEAARLHHPGQAITGIFQPHLFSRTRDHLEDFGTILATLDRVFILPIYAAREKPLDGIDSQRLFENIPSTTKHLIRSEQIFDNLKEHPPKVLMTLGAGDIDRIVEPLTRWLEEDPSRFEPT